MVTQGRLGLTSYVKETAEECLDVSRLLDGADRGVTSSLVGVGVGRLALLDKVRKITDQQGGYITLLTMQT